MSRIALLCFVLSCFFLSSDVFGQSVRFRLDATNTSGDVVETVGVGDTFFLNAYTEDLGPDPGGVFAAYLDVLIEPTIASVIGPVEPGIQYQNGASDGVVSAGLLNNFGGFASVVDPFGAGELLVFSQEMQADALGEIEFTSAFANESPMFDVLRFGVNEAVLAADIEFGSLTLQVAEVPEPSCSMLFCLGGVAMMLSRRRR